MTFRLLIAAWLVALTLPAGAAETGAVVPDFTLKGVDGRNVRFADHLGEVRVLVFTSQKCGACKHTFAAVGTALKSVDGRGVVAWGISRDRYASTAKRQAKEDGVTIPVLHDEHGRTSFGYGIEELPTLMVIDRDGRLRQTWTGREARSPEGFAALLRGVAEE